VVKGRRWRATDPSIPDDIEEELKHHLARGRRAVRGTKGANGPEIVLARRRIALAKLGLGERGKPEWWNDTSQGRRERWRGALTALRMLDEK